MPTTSISSTKRWKEIPATRNAVVWTGITIYRIEDNKIIEEWNESDQLGIMLQIDGYPVDPNITQTTRTGDDFLWTKQTSVSGDPGTPESNKNILVDGLARLAITPWDSVVLSPDFINHDPSFPQVVTKEEFLEWDSGNVDLEGVVLEFPILVAEGDKVANRWLWSYTEPYVGGKRIYLPGHDIQRFADNRIVERWSTKDFVSFFAQYETDTSVDEWGLY